MARYTNKHYHLDMISQRKMDSLYTIGILYKYYNAHLKILDNGNK